MTPEEAVEYVRETQRIADENHHRAVGLYDLIFPPWRWLKWWREYRAIRAVIREVEHRNGAQCGSYFGHRWCWLPVQP